MLLAAAERAGIKDKVHVLTNGQSLHLTSV
jgi:hypothetical protein